MARPLRIEFPGALYHVTARGNERRAIYRTDHDRRRFLSILQDIVEHFRLVLHAYVLMGNHYHLLVETLEPNLARAMHDLNGTYAQSFNRRHGRVGHLLQGRYKAPLVQYDAYLIELSRYIHLNPVRARIVDRADEYPWSSARAYVRKSAAPPFLTVAEVLGSFGDRLRSARRRYASFLAEGCESRTPSPLDNLVAQTLLGEPEWVEAMRARIDACMRSGRVALELHGEVPASRQILRRPSLAQVVTAVAAATNTEPRRIYRRHSRVPARAVTIYLASKETGLSHKDVGAAFGIESFAVSKVVAGVARKQGVDRKLRRLLQRLRAALECPASENG